VFVLGTKEIMNAKIEVVGEITPEQIAQHEAMAA